ncbi:ABC transporter permease [Bauldia sp.]|uniref:ABC transporter permease n=1 Tax=Bauldia sp. TaxID=2575872 RepID=UPI003BAA07B9
MTMTIDETIAKQTHSNVLSWIVSRQVFWVSVAALVGCILLTLLTDTFATERNLFNVTRNFSFIGIIALGMTAVIITGGIDLSVGSVVVFAAMICGMSMSGGLVIWLAIPLALGGAMLVGFVNGAAISWVGMPPFVVTLGSLSIVRSLAMVLSQNKMVYEFGPDQDKLLWLGGGDTLGIPNPLIVLIALALITGFLFRWTTWGRHVYAIGGNETAARLTGVPVSRIKISVYMFASFLAGVTGVLEVGWLGGVTTNLGQAMELNVIAAAVIGGANLAGGIGTAFGAVVGALLIEVIRNSLILLGISTFWQGTFIGSFIMLAVAFDRLRKSS